MALNDVQIKEMLDLAAISCEHIIQAARDVALARKDVFPARIVVTEEKKPVEITEVTEFDLLRRKLDLGHIQISKSWLQKRPSKDQKAIRIKLVNSLQSIVWFTNVGCALLSFPQCCQAIDDGIRLINPDYRATSGMLLEPELFAERILEDPEKMVSLLEQLQFSIKNSSSLKTENEKIIDEWVQTDCYFAVDLNELSIYGEELSIYEECEDAKKMAIE